MMFAKCCTRLQRQKYFKVVLYKTGDSAQLHFRGQNIGSKGMSCNLQEQVRREHASIAQRSFFFSQVCLATQRNKQDCKQGAASRFAADAVIVHAMGFQQLEIFGLFLLFIQRCQ